MSHKEVSYLTLPTSELLEQFGAGRHIPGSGSASALSALLACELMSTVCKLTCAKPNYASVHKDLSYILEQIQTDYKPELIKLFNRDIQVFSEVSELRRKRDDETNPAEKGKLTRAENERMKEATEIPLQICDVCLKLITHALNIFDSGFKSARGDSGVALSNLLSAISGSLFISFLNLKTGKHAKWVENLRTEAEKIALQYNGIHKEAIKRIMDLYQQGLPDDYQTKLELS